MHDFVTVWYLLNQDAVSLSRVPIKVIPDQGKDLVKSIADFRFVTNPGYKTHNVAFQFDYEKFKKDIMETFLKKRV